MYHYRTSESGHRVNLYLDLNLKATFKAGFEVEISQAIKQ